MSSPAATSAFQLRSSAFEEGAPIPARYSHASGDISPPLTWSGVPTGTVELVVLVDDPDAPIPGTFVHWVLTGIRPEVSSIGEGETPDGAVVGPNGFGAARYLGPEPPIGDPPHHYYFRLYALREPLATADELTFQAVRRAAESSAIVTATLTGTYQRG